MKSLRALVPMVAAAAVPLAWGQAAPAPEGVFRIYRDEVIYCHLDAASPGSDQCTRVMGAEELKQRVRQPVGTLTATTPTTAVAAATGGAMATTSATTVAPQTEKKSALDASTPAQKKTAFDLLTTYSQVDLAVPASPAFNILGVSPDKVQRPGFIRDFATSLARGIGPDGKTTEALAIDISPVSVFAKSLVRGGSAYYPGAKEGTTPNDLSLEGYPTRVLARTTLSLATTKPDASGASRTAWGLRVGLIDFGDPGLYWQFTSKCLRDTPMPSIGLLKGRDLEPTLADDSLAACNPQTKPVAMGAPLWALPALYAGYGNSWYSKSGSLTDRAPDARAAWLSFSIGHAAIIDSKAAAEAMGDWRALLQLYASRRLNDRATDPNNAGALLRQDSSEGSLRLRLGKETWHGYVEYGKRHVRLGDAVTESLRTTAVGAEFKLAFLTDDSWVQLASVRERGFADGKDKTAITMNLKIGVPFLELPGAKPETKK